MFLAKAKFKNLTITLLCTLLTVYFIYHSFSGDRGIFVYLKLKQEYQKLQNELENTRSERLDIEHKVNLLQPESLDLDLLEERARSVLFFAKPTEEIFLENIDEDN
jgi:cell division protein FtsB